MNVSDIEKAQHELSERLPLRARWLIRDVPLNFDFHRSLHPLRCARDELPELPADTSTLFIFGEQDYADGGGATHLLVLEATSGVVWALDLESENYPLRFINSSVAQFVRAFSVLDAALGGAEPALAGVSDMLATIDPDARGRSEWFELLDGLSPASRGLANKQFRRRTG